MDPDAPAVVLSPHLDDAVLSAFSVLVGPGEVVVVNVFDGEPPPGPPSVSARLCGASDGAAQMRRRLAEDRAALARVGRGAVGLGFVEHGETGERPDVETVSAAIASVVPVASALVAPIGIGSHPDHVLARDAGLLLARAGGVPLELYAELPYAINWGWPAWVSGDDPDPDLDPSVAWEGALARLPAPPGTPRVVALDGAQAAAKAQAVAAYASQLPMLAGGPHRRLGEWAFRYEVLWPIDAG